MKVQINVIRIFLCMTISAYTFITLAAKPISVSVAEFGGNWPFKRQEMMLECKSDGRLFAINENSLVSYPLNDLAQQSLQGITSTPSIDAILKDDLTIPNKKMDYQNIIQKAMTLCE